MNQFHNKVVVVTGAAQGIGKEVAKQYVKQGAKVVLADINEELGQASMHRNLTMNENQLFLYLLMFEKNKILSIL